MEPPTGLIPWFSKTEGNTYATLLHHPFLFKEKTNGYSRGSKKDFWRRCREVFAQVKTYQVPITNSSPSHYIICHLPLVFVSPTSPLSFYSPSVFRSSLFRLPLVCPFALMALPKNADLHLRRLEEIEINIRSFMALQFEHNNFFRNELKEQKSFMEYMNKELDDMSKEFYGLNSQFARLEKSIAQISDKRATLVNKMAANQKG